MKYLSYIVVGLAALMLVYFGFFDGKKTQLNNDQQVEQLTSTKQWETKTDDQPPVAIKATPVELGKNARVWKFDVAFDTHSESLDENPTEVIILYDDKGKAYRPTSWEGAGPGGHHREGVLIFEAVNPVPPYIELKIKDVGGVPERSFKWNL